MYEAHGQEYQEGHDMGDHGSHDQGSDDWPDEGEQDDNDDHGNDRDPGGHSHGHHMPEKPAETAPAAKTPGFFARLFGKK